MSLIETVIEGTLQADGTLVLDENPNLPPGRVTVLLRQQAPYRAAGGRSVLAADAGHVGRAEGWWPRPSQ